MMKSFRNKVGVGALALVVGMGIGVGCNLLTGAETAELAGTGGGTSTTTTTTTIATTTTTTTGTGGSAAVCANGKKDGDESDVDCGGGACGSPCPRCANDHGCAVNSDCVSGRCTAGLCVPWSARPGCFGASCYDFGRTSAVVVNDCGDIIVGGNQITAIDTTCTGSLCQPKWKPLGLGVTYGVAFDPKSKGLFAAGYVEKKSELSCAGSSLIWNEDGVTNEHGWVAAVDGEGSCTWALGFVGTDPGPYQDNYSAVHVRAVAADAAGDVYVVGYSGALSIDFRPGPGDAGAPLKLDNPSQGPFVRRSVFVAKVGVAGAQPHMVKWAKMFGSTTGGVASTDGKTIVVVADPSNAGKEQVVVAGSFVGAVDFEKGAPLTASAGLRGFVLALDPATGETSWVREVHGANDEGTTVTELATAANGHVFYAGRSDDTIVFGEYDAAGSPLGSTSTPTPAGEHCHASGLVADDEGLLSTWWCAKDTQCGSCPTGNQFFHLTRVKPGAAAPRWTQDYGPIDTSGPVQELAPQLALSPTTGNVVIAGIFNAPTLTVTGGTVLVSPDPGQPKGFVASFGALP